MNEPYSGKHLWIWQLASTLSGNVQEIIKLGHSLGLTGWIVKSHDGTTVWPQFAQVVKLLQDAGFVVGSWGFVYGTNPAGEAQAAQISIDAGADWYVIDAETSFEGNPQAAVQLGNALRAKNPNLPIAYAPFAVPSAHPTFPYKEFSAFCNVCLPQIYWIDFGMALQTAIDTSYSELATYSLPIVPVAQAYGTATAAQLLEFGTLTKAKGSVGITYWDAQSANTQQLQAIGQTHEFSLVRSQPTPTSTTSAMPSDISPDAWYYAAVRDLLDRHIITAYHDGLFKPDQYITRAQAADWINRMRMYLEAEMAAKKLTLP